MSEDNIWLAGRRQERDALGRIILTLEHDPARRRHRPGVRGAGVDARTGHRSAPAGPAQRDNN